MKKKSVLKLIKNGDLEEIKDSLSIMDVGENFTSILKIALDADRIDVCKYVIDTVAPIPSSVSFTNLNKGFIFIIKNGNLELLKYLCDSEHISILISADSVSWDTLSIMETVNLDILKYLVEKIESNSDSKKFLELIDSMAIRAKAYNADKSIIEYLLSKGARISDEYSIFKSAAAIGNIELMTALYNKNKNMEIHPSDIILSCIKYNALESIKFIILHFPDSLEKIEENQFLVEYAINKGRLKILKYFIETLHLPLMNRHINITRAVYKDYYKMLEYLIGNGLLDNYFLRDIISSAICTGKIDILKLIFENNDINAYEIKSFNDCIKLALEYYRKEIIEYLISIK